mmetsp:Transcript_1504/g.3117  ORF Transcript_1504/g.3117 Transcript_1504/m.3117 type:complete len:253 (+) Transcript_1504:289-1047(+)
MDVPNLQLICCKFLHRTRIVSCPISQRVDLESCTCGTWTAAGRLSKRAKVTTASRMADTERPAHSAVAETQTEDPGRIAHTPKPPALGATAREAELADAVAAYHTAVGELRTLRKFAVIEITAMKSPPEGTLEAVCIIKGIKPTNVIVHDGTGVWSLDYWAAAKRMVGDSRFLPSLCEVNQDSISEATIKKLRPYLANESFSPEAVAQSSPGGAALCKWVRAVVRYREVSKAIGKSGDGMMSAQSTLVQPDG